MALFLLICRQHLIPSVNILHLSLNWVSDRPSAVGLSAIICGRQSLLSKSPERASFRVLYNVVTSKIQPFNSPYHDCRWCYHTWLLWSGFFRLFGSLHLYICYNTASVLCLWHRGAKFTENVLVFIINKEARLTLCRPVWVLLVFMQRNQIKIMSEKIKVSSCSLRLHSCLLYTEIPTCFSFCSSFLFHCQF